MVYFHFILSSVLSCSCSRSGTKDESESSDFLPRNIFAAAESGFLRGFEATKQTALVRINTLWYFVLVKSEVLKSSMRSSHFGVGGGGVLCSPTQPPVLWDLDNELAGNHLIEQENILKFDSMIFPFCAHK